MKDCKECQGTGVCPDCDGSGKDIFQETKDCDLCDGTGNCPDCDGSGKFEEEGTATP
jgi:DnaJ-class molecular chaperone